MMVDDNLNAGTMDAEPRKVEDPQAPTSPNWTADISDIKTVKMSNIALGVSEKDIFEFFSFSGDIDYIEMQRESETTQVAYVTFRDSQGADTSVLLTGAVISGLAVSITRVPNYQLPPDATPFTSRPKSTTPPSAFKKAEDVVSTMLAKGFVLGKDALNKAKSLDEKHRLTSNASATVASIKIGLSGKVKEMDERYQVSEITKSALAAAEQKASSAGSAIMSNPYVSSGAAWFTNALQAVSKAAEDVGALTKEKVEKAGQEKREIHEKERAAIAYKPINAGPAESTAIPVKLVDETNKDVTNTGRAESPTIPVKSVDETNKIEHVTNTGTAESPTIPVESVDETNKIEDVTVTTKEKVEKAEEEKRGIPEKETAKVACSPASTGPAESPTIPVKSVDESNKIV